MPIKLPKSFPRGKSSGNPLDELPNPPEPSFRVFERPESKSFDGGQALKRMSYGRPLSAGHLDGEHLQVGARDSPSPNNRGSGGTNNSRSSGGHDNASLSGRYSSSSTLPSSTDLPLDDRPPPKAKDPYVMPAPPIPESSPMSLRNAGRKFSFGRKKAETASIPAPRPVVEHTMSDGYAGYTRERATTESSYASESTATPPKLLDTSLDFENSSLDNLGTMFESFGKSRSQIDFDQGALGLGNTESPANMSPSGTRMLAKPYTDERSTLTPPPLNIDRASKITGSPRSWVSHDSQDGLMSSQSPAMERTFSYENEQEPLRAGQALSKCRTMPLPSATSPSHRKTQQRPPSMAADGLRRSSVYAGRRESARESALLHDDDARLVMDSLSASRRLDRNIGGPYHDSDEEEGNPAAALVSNSSYPSSPYASSGAQQTMYTDNRQRSPGPMLDSRDRGFSSTPWQPSADTTPRARKAVPQPEERSMFDASPPIPGRAAPPPPRIEPPQKPKTQNKIMTPAQFERYRKEQEMTSTANRQAAHDASDEEGDDYEDDDEIEHNKQLARQRRKQEAHLAVYRQQMMKMTGEQPSDLPSVQLRPAMERASMSTPNLQDRSNTLSINFDKSDEEDEDVPLGVLAAHGFPSKNRPPTEIGTVDTMIKYQSESYPPPAASTKSGAGAGRAAGLPAFARKLPQDPFYGAGLVNPSNRESLAFGHNGPGSAYGGQPSMPPGGLVGVIAGEEQARAGRRGSPNANGNYGSPLPPGMNMMPGMPPGMPPMMTPGEQATVQMSERMNQMMQMQMQWMQQMQQMMAVQPGQQPPFMPPGMMNPGMMNPSMSVPPGPQPRPMSVAAPPGPSAPPLGQRSQSMMGPGPSLSWPPQGNNRQSVAPSMMSGGLGGPGPGYTPSIAPSERSNVGMPSRYRPVSIAPADEHIPRSQSRASTFTSGTLMPGPGRESRLSTSTDRHSKVSLRPVSRIPPPRLAVSDEDDEEGWEEMKKKREQKKSTWRSKKNKGDDLGLEGLDVYDYPEA